MSKQKITYPDYGARVQRALEAVTPINDAVAPAINATYIGQIYVDETTPKVYISVAVGSETPANDWKELAFAVGAGE